ncbi:MAG: 2-amino-4-hydroxy-6-hydroxymethyldihydropteridine diphosphokinase [Sphingomonadales bacterium]
MAGQIIIGLGANLPGQNGETPLETCQLALGRLAKAGVMTTAVSPVYESEPYPPSDQPWFLNAVALIETKLLPKDLLAALLEVEEGLGRQRAEKNDPRIIDLDLIDYLGAVLPGPAAWLGATTDPDPTGIFLPHLRAHERVFVLKPLLDLVPVWQHPVIGKSAAELLEGLEMTGKIRPIKGELQIP